MSTRLKTFMVTFLLASFIPVLGGCLPYHKEGPAFQAYASVIRNDEDKTILTEKIDTNATFTSVSQYDMMYTPCNVYKFELPSGDRLFIGISRSFPELDLSVDETYHLSYTRYHPEHYDAKLIIYHNDELLFAGETRYGATGYFQTANPGFPVHIEHTDNLTSRRKGGDDCYDSIYNTVITFTLASGEDLTLTQNQTGELGDYTVYLPIARKVETNQTCPDFYMEGLSWTITRNKK